MKFIASTILCLSLLLHASHAGAKSTDNAAKQGADVTAHVQDLHHQGLVFLKKADYANAEMSFKHALNIAEKPRRHPVLASVCLTSLGTLNANEGNYKDAEILYRKSLANTVAAYGSKSPKVAIALSHLADLYRLRADCSAAEKLNEKALKIMDSAHSTELDKVSLLTNLALIYRDQARYADAEALFNRISAVWEKMPSTINRSSYSRDLAGFYQDAGNYKKAEEFYQQALTADEAELGASHPVVASDLSDLGQLYGKVRQFDKARSLLEKAVSIDESHLPQDDYRLASPINNLGYIYTMQGNYTEAERLYNRSLHIAREHVGPAHPSVATTLSNLGMLNGDQRKFSEANKLYREALTIKERAYGREHPAVAIIFNNQASLMRMSGKLKEAEFLYKRALEIDEKTLGNDHPQTATVAYNLAILYDKTNRQKDAALLYKRALNVFKSTYGADDAEVAACRKAYEKARTSALPPGLL